MANVRRNRRKRPKRPAKCVAVGRGYQNRRAQAMQQG